MQQSLNILPSDAEVDLDRNYAALAILFWPSKTTWLPAQANGFQLDVLVDGHTIKD